LANTPLQDDNGYPAEALPKIIIISESSGSQASADPRTLILQIGQPPFQIPLLIRQ
jgi:hypothetical protein